MRDNTPEYTPVEKHGDMLAKRDDHYMVAGIRGGKVRACRELMYGAIGAVTASARKSPQMQIVARLANALQIPCHCHTASGPYTPEMHDVEVHGAKIVQHRPGYNSVIIARAKADADEIGYRYVPFGMECSTAIDLTATQAKHLKAQIIRKGWKLPRRIVVCVGSGMSAAGILWGLRQAAWLCPVVGIQIGADAKGRLHTWAPIGWHHQLKLFNSRWKYTQEVYERFGSVLVDPHYEAKVLEHLQPRDLFWVVGIRAGLQEDK